MNVVQKRRSVYFYMSYILSFRAIRTFQFRVVSFIALLRFFAASFVRSYPGDWPAFSRAGNFGFSARFYRRPGPAFLA
jgi:hypothetical protein